MRAERQTTSESVADQEAEVDGLQDLSFDSRSQRRPSLMRRASTKFKIKSSRISFHRRRMNRTETDLVDDQAVGRSIDE